MKSDTFYHAMIVVSIVCGLAGLVEADGYGLLVGLLTPLSVYLIYRLLRVLLIAANRFESNQKGN